MFYHIWSIRTAVQVLTENKVVVITRQFNPTISQFNSSYNEFMSIWPMFVYNKQSVRS